MLQRELPDRLRFVFRHFPLEEIHPHARAAATAAGVDLRRVEAYSHHTPHVDADRRQSQTRAYPVPQRVVECRFTVTLRGLTMSTIPFGQRMFQVEFDL